MKSSLTLLALLLCVAIIALAPEAGPQALILCTVLAFIGGFIISRGGRGDDDFLLLLFVSALLVRMFVGLIIYEFNLQAFFGGDALTYDFFGNCLLKGLEGDRIYMWMAERYSAAGAVGWGMLYLIAGVYALIGRNMLAVQFINAVIGAATVPLIFGIAMELFANRRVARVAAILVAFYPSIVLWSSQGLKDGPIVFLLALTMYSTLRLGSKFSVWHLVYLIAALLGLLTLRFYIFYIALAAITGAFVIGMRKITGENFVRQFVVIVIIGLALTYVGISRYATVQFEAYANLKQIAVSRDDAAKSAESGFATDADVSTTSGALSTIPIGMAYLLFAPFPWQLASLRQSITLPEMLVWWGSFPLLVLGIWFTVRYKLREASPILIFTSMLTLAYSVFEGNVGTAYRQRSQLLIFYFIFVGVGFVLYKEKREARLASDSKQGRR